jgi:hypothetical protein
VLKPGVLRPIRQAAGVGAAVNLIEPKCRACGGAISDLQVDE